MDFYFMADGVRLAVAGRGTTRDKITELQDAPWVKVHGGICAVVTYSERLPICFAAKTVVHQEGERTESRKENKDG